MLKKAGMLTVGVTAGLLAVAPIASAGESNVKGDSDKEHSKDRDGDHKDRDKGHKSKKHHDGDQDGNGNIKCENSSGDRETVPSDAALADVLGAGALNDNTGNLLSCNSILNGNALSIGVLGDAGAEV